MGLFHDSNVIKRLISRISSISAFLGFSLKVLFISLPVTTLASKHFAHRGKRCHSYPCWGEKGLLVLAPSRRPSHGLWRRPRRPDAAGRAWLHLNLPRRAPSAEATARRPLDPKARPELSDDGTSPDISTMRTPPTRRQWARRRPRE